MNLVLDIGNTFAKLALFEGQEMQIIYRVSNSPDGLISSNKNDEYYFSESLSEKLQYVLDNYDISSAILTTVKELDENVSLILSKILFPLITLSPQTSLPIRISYKTPHTLGTDRIAAAVGAYTIAPGKNLLVIDAGTAVTYDFVSSEGIYYGGNIAPGMHMRLKALHEFTGKLPLVSAAGATPLIGEDTETAIRSGVVWGILHEIKGYIANYREKHPDLLVFLTGGDAKRFATPQESCIFADDFLVLKGLNAILSFNSNL
ncbi:MAG: type III pantothenate kinase [Bacteroidaceae bacterium]